MNTAFLCLFVALVIPYILAFSSIPFRLKQFGNVNFNDPRAQGEQLVENGARIVAAQKNAWEALAVFAVTLLIGVTYEVPENVLATASLVFIGARIAHAFFYMMGQGALRALSFGAAFGACLWIMIIALF